MSYSDYISIKTTFKRSSNIIHDNSCESYILSTSSIESLRRIFITNTSNCFAITGPFGSGKSSFMIFLESLLKNKNKSCINKLKEKAPEIYASYKEHLPQKNSEFLIIKIIGEHLSFRYLFTNAIKELGELKQTRKILEAENTSFNKILSTLEQERKDLGYSGVLILIDELGKVIEYASEKYLESDIHSIQDLAEFANNQPKFKLLVALHKSFKDYAQNNLQQSFTEWDKIQGRFDNMLFQDDFYELINIFEEALEISDEVSITKAREQVRSTYQEYLKINNDKFIPINQESLINLAPLHPFASLAVFNIFSRYFQNQRSIFSFLVAEEPYSFQSFINQEENSNQLYSLDDLFDYINYLTNIYNIQILDKESWKLANDYIDNANTLSDTQIRIIKSVAIVSAFKLEHLIKLDKEALHLALSQNISKELDKLLTQNILIHKLSTGSFSLIEETSIDINEELTLIMSTINDFDLASEINKFFNNEAILAKRFFIKTGTAKFFSQRYIDLVSTTVSFKDFEILYLDSKIAEKELSKISKEKSKNLFITVTLSKDLEFILKQSIAAEVLLNKTQIQSNRIVKRILLDILNSNTNEAKRVFKLKSKIFFDGEKYTFSTKNMQESIDLKLINKEKTIVIPNAIDNNVFYSINKNKAREKLGYKIDDFIIAYIGAFSHRKGVLRLANAIHEIDDDLKSIYIGSGDLEPKGK
ncbi:MAG: hypothetical protein ACOCRK_02320 [bacterium]